MILLFRPESGFRAKEFSAVLMNSFENQISEQLNNQIMENLFFKHFETGDLRSPPCNQSQAPAVTAAWDLSRVQNAVH